VVADDSPFTVRIGGGAVAVPCTAVDSYVPVVGDFVALVAQGADRVVIGAVGEGSVPLGFIAEATATASQNTITTVVDLTGLSVTWTALPGRRYRIEGRAHFQAASGAPSAILQITDTTPTLQRDAVILATTALPLFVTVDHEVEPAAGSVTYKLRALSGGTINMVASATRYASIRVYDVGAA
jgi:hypothetical protein